MSRIILCTVCLRVFRFCRARKAPRTSKIQGLRRSGVHLGAYKPETQARVLAVWARVLRSGALRKLLPRDVHRLERILEHSSSAERRAAAMPALSLAYQDGSNPAWPSLAKKILMTETNPTALGALAESCYEVDEVVCDQAVQQAFLQKLPALSGRPAYAQVVRFLQLSEKPSSAFSNLYRLWRAQPDPKMRQAILEVLLDLAEKGILSHGLRPGAPGSVEPRLIQDRLTQQYLELYRGTPSLPARVRLVCIGPRVLGLSQPAWASLLTEMAPFETDPKLRQGIERLAKAAADDRKLILGTLQMRHLLGFPGR